MLGQGGWAEQEKGDSLEAPPSNSQNVDCPLNRRRLTRDLKKKHPSSLDKSTLKNDEFPTFEPGTDRAHRLRNVVSANNHFDVRMGRALLKGNQNVKGSNSSVWSPFGTSTTLAMLMAGAGGKTKESLHKFFVG